MLCEKQKQHMHGGLEFFDFAGFLHVTTGMFFFFAFDVFIIIFVLLLFTKLLKLNKCALASVIATRQMMGLGLRKYQRV